MNSWVQAQVVELKQHTPRLYSLFIAALGIEFKAGQFAFLKGVVNGKEISRPYSFVNSPEEDVFEFYFNTVPGGSFSHHLAALKKGDTIFISQKASGTMTLDRLPRAKHLWLFATGTGIGPFISMLKTREPWDLFEKISLIYGAREESELGFRNKIDMFSSQRANSFVPIYCTSREQSSIASFGRIPELYNSGDIEQHAGLTITQEESQVMLCGNSGMIKSMQETLAERGLKKNRAKVPGNITMEKYW